MDYVDLGKIWISVTAYGREGDEASRVGFGDDVAAGAGLVTALKNVPYPVGDAIADPLAGVYSAAAATVSLSSHYGCLIDVSMHDVVRSAAMLEVDEPAAVIERIEQRWVIRLRDRSLRVSSPRARRPKGHAPSFGQHTNSVFQEFYV
jgi:crotonobetainyl-CoA:carnitine CoA-transferase CaiB-like acyl-CoA transferase